MFLFAIKWKARGLTHGFLCRASLLALPAAVSFLCALLCLLLSTLCFYYGAAAVFGADPLARAVLRPDGAARAAPWSLLAAGVLFLWLYGTLRGRLLASFYTRAAGTSPAPARFAFPGTGVRTLLCDAVTALKKTGWLALLTLPAAVTAGCCYLLLRAGALTPPLLVCGALLAGLQFCAGAVFTFIITRRYCLMLFLLHRTPGLRLRDAAARSAVLTRGKRLRTAAYAAQMLPWVFLGLLPPAAPFVFVYTGLIHAVICETLVREAEAPPVPAGPPARRSRKKIQK